MFRSSITDYTDHIAEYQPHHTIFTRSGTIRESVRVRFLRTKPTQAYWGDREYRACRRRKIDRDGAQAFVLELRGREARPQGKRSRKRTAKRRSVVDRERQRRQRLFWWKAE